jgi:hypothetical protein
MGDRKQGYAMKMVVDGKEKTISFEELAISNKLTLDALIGLLITKGVFEPKELLDEISRIKRERFRSEGDAQQQ